MKVRPLDKIEEIIIHTSDSSYGSTAVITGWHLENGWDTIGYNYVILNGFINDSKYYEEEADGMLELGRSLHYSGAHCKGHNTKSIGICMIGKDGEFTDNQYKALMNLVTRLKIRFEGIEVYFHSDFDDNKPNCPGITPTDIIFALSN